MAQGVPTPEEKIAEFRAEYLYSRNASATGRKLDIEERTARRLAEEYEAEPAFAEAVRVLRATYLDKLTTMRMSVAETAHERFHDPECGIETRRFGGKDDATIVITDKRHEYGKLVLDAEKNAQALAKAETPVADGNISLHVHLKRDDEDPPDGGGSEAA
jgi:hypothetical protein